MVTSQHSGPESDTRKRHGRAADDLVRRFASMIHSGALQDGKPLPPEREIVETYGVSRTVVREAVLALSNKGLVEARPRHRPVVRRAGYDTAFSTVNDVVTRLLTEADGVKNLFDTRVMIEASLVRQAAIDATKDEIAALKQALDANETAIGDSELFYRTDVGFHAVLYDFPQNPLVKSMHRAYTTWLAPYWSQMPRLPERNRANFEAHKRIFDGILLRDPDAAERALRAHLAAAWGQVRENMDD